MSYIFPYQMLLFAGYPETFHISVTFVVEGLSTSPGNYLCFHIYLIYGCLPYMFDQQEEV